MKEVWESYVSTGYILPAVTFFTCWLVGYFFLRFALRRIQSWTQKSKATWDDKFVSYARVPLHTLNLVIALGAALSFAPESIRSHPAAKMAPAIVLILLAAWILVRLATGAIENAALPLELGEGAKRFLVNLVRVSFFAIGILIILDTLGISITPLLASLGVGSIAVALALQDTLTNFFSGIYMLIDRPVREGDFIRVDGTAVEGTVRKIGWRSTRIELGSNNVVVIPNSKLSSSILINFDFPYPELGFAVPLSVSYDSDLKHVERITLDVAAEIQKSVKGAVPSHQPSVRYTSFGASAINFDVGLRAVKFGDSALLKHEFIKAIHERYKKEAIEIPFPQTVVHMKTPTRQ